MGLSMDPDRKFFTGMCSEPGRQEPLLKISGHFHVKIKCIDKACLEFFYSIHLENLG